MLERFNSYIKANALCQPGDRILLAVSGGIDSVVMLSLFSASAYKGGIAHCNFQLREDESDQDAVFVKTLAKKYSFEFHLKEFDTSGYAEEKGISIQMAARELRYQWFNELLESGPCEYLATAHNQDDVLETFFINLSRGTGIKGLTGIPARSGNVIRPLLFASREEIQQYAEDKGLSYREDSSNVSDKYLRNRIRHKLLPMLEEENPSFRKSLLETMGRLGETEQIFLDEINRRKQDLLERDGERYRIRISKLLDSESRKTLLHEILSEFNFNPSSIDDIIKSLTGPPGKQFFSPSHRIVKDRESLILSKLRTEAKGRYYLELGMGQIYDPVGLEWVVLDRTDNFRIPEDPDVACLDFELLDFPLILRHWQKGDYFQPLGLEGLKKLSDFLIDRKISLPDKENIWLLASGQKISWVVGHRIDHRFRITDRTKQILMVRYKP